MRWFRFYTDAIKNPKIAQLNDHQFRAWVSILCIAASNQGNLPPIKILAKLLGMRPLRCKIVTEQLTHMRLIVAGDPSTACHLSVHDWSRHQYVSDQSTQRVRDFRKRFKSVSETPPDNRVQITDSKEVSKKEERIAPNGADAGGKYVYENGPIRLNERDFTRWQQSFSDINLRAELESLSPWAAKQNSGWFHAVAGALAKRNREAKLQKEAVKFGIQAGQRRDRLGGGTA